MNLDTGIEWTDATSNPIKYRDCATGEIVWACVKHSAGCANCYAETLAKRYGRGGPFTRDSMNRVEPFLCEKECKSLLTSKKLGGKRVFLGDMTDIFGEWVPDDLLNRLFTNVLERRTDVIFQLLTKRADRMRQYLSWRWGEGRIPSRHIYCGTSVENQKAADERIPLLLQTPAAVRFLSCEPLLSGVDLRNLNLGCHYIDALTGVDLSTSPPTHGAGGRIDWVIVGGESGHDARAFGVEWARSIVEQCKAAGVACFVKQLGSRPTTRLEPGETWPGHDGPLSPVQFSGDGFGNYFVSGLRDRKGGDPVEWPEDLRVRQFPTVEPAT